MRIKDLPVEVRPRERLIARGSESLSNTDLIAILLRTGTKGMSAMRIAEDLLGRFGSLGALANADIPEIRKTKGIGRDKAIALKSAFTLAKRMAREIRREPPILDAPEKVADLLRDEISDHKVESCHILLLNTRNRLIRMEQIATGTLDTLLIHPREIFRPAILHQAATLVLAHNHPSGDPSPSEADIRITRDLVRAGKLLNIEILDHVIIGSLTKERTVDFSSLRELGHFYA
ncbi:MAG: hypothetical protein M2R45_02902 [Verrucomicrobia subdivision 3 bacterium]|nr:hypothetical protein [Limisphaerales bacterium]MCS1414754.1 hypothetical protein [Limisphaerales bacterium]